MSEPLNIAVDARPLVPPLKGIGRYTRELLERMVEGENQWHLYSHAPLDDSLLRHSNVDQHTVPLAKNLSGVSSLVAQLVFPVWAYKHDIDLFWSPRHHLPLGLPRSIATLVSVHDLVWKLYPETMSRGGRLLEQLLMAPSLKRADAIATVSQSTYDQLLDYYPDLVNKLFLAPCGASVDTLAEKAAAPVAGRYFLFVGTPEPRKNLPRLIEAYKYAYAINCDLPKLVIAGSGGWGDVSLQHRVNQAGLHEQVVCLGYVDDERLSELYEYAYALLMPSLYEGFGLPLLEAMRFGVPVLTSNCYSMPEVAGDAGVFVDPMSVESIGCGLLALLDEEKYRVLAHATNGQLEKFCWDSSAQEMLRIMDSLCELKANSSLKD